MRESGATISNKSVSDFKQTGINLLKLGFINRVYTWKGFPAIIQIVFLVIFLLLITLGLNLFTPKEYPGNWQLSGIDYEITIRFMASDK
jgi:di/tricarboxylate transporter